MNSENKVLLIWLEESRIGKLATLFIIYYMYYEVEEYQCFKLKKKSGLSLQLCH